MKDLIKKSAVTENRILFGNDGVKEGQKFVTTSGFKEENLGSEALFNTMNFMLDMPDQSAHSLTSLINIKVGKEDGYAPMHPITGLQKWRSMRCLARLKTSTCNTWPRSRS